MKLLKKLLGLCLSLLMLCNVANIHAYADISHDNMGEEAVEGIDVSYWQGEIDWQKVKAAGKKFVIIRAGYTNIDHFEMHPDPKFQKYIQGAHDAGLIIGIYYFSQAITPQEAKLEAEYTVSLINAYKDYISLPVFMDYEWSRDPNNGYRANNGASVSERTAIVDAFVSGIYSAGYQPGLYMSASYLDTEVDWDTLDEKYPIWMAAYGENRYYDGKYSLHQYTSSGKVDGIDGNVDLDWWFTMAVPMYRLYNPNSGEHFYTSNTTERDSLEKTGWKYEGVAWNAVEASTTPVYRLYNAIGGEHHYTTSIKERESLVESGWKYEGIGWYSNDDKTIPLYRLYNPNAFANNHHYTASVEERDYLLSLGWKDEGTAWFGRNA